MVVAPERGLLAVLNRRLKSDAARRYFPRIWADYISGAKLLFKLRSIQYFWNPGTIWRVMHFSKYYTQLLLSLPPELRENAISYRQASPRSLSTDLLH